MSVTTCPRCPTRDDSALSKTANIAGVLTFAYAIAAGLWFYYWSLRNVSRDVRNILDDSRGNQLGAFLLPSDFWPMEEIEQTTEGEQLIRIKNKIASLASRRTASLRQRAKQFRKAFGESVGFRGRIRFMFSQQDMAERAASVGQALEMLKSADVRYERFAESLYRKQQVEAVENQQKMLNDQGRILEELRSRLKVLEVAMKVPQIEGVPSMESLAVKPRALQSQWC